MRKPIVLAALALLLFAGAFLLGRRSLPSSQDEPASARTDASGAANAPGAQMSAPAHSLQEGLGPSGMPSAVSAEDALGTGPASSAQAAAQAALPPTERELLAREGLRAEVAQRAVEHPHFDQFVSSLLRGADADALDLTRAYQERMSKLLAVDPRFRFDTIACSAQLCAATAHAPTGLDDALSALVMASSKGGAPFYAFVDAGVPTAGDPSNAQYRLLFTIDPKLKGFEIDPTAAAATSTR